jgi:hypothetical protein
MTTALDEKRATVDDELRQLAAAKMARRPAGDTLDATALVHEAYLRLVGETFVDRGEFLRAAAVAMQRILVDQLASSAPRRAAVQPRDSPSTDEIASLCRIPTRSWRSMRP